MFFKKREVRGIKPPRHPSKPAKGEEAAAAEAQAGPILAALTLPGESEDCVEVYGAFAASNPNSASHAKSNQTHATKSAAKSTPT